VYTLLSHGMNPLWIRSTGAQWQVWFQNSSGTSTITLGLGTSIDGVTNFDQWRFGDLCEIECDHVTGEVIWRNITRNKSASAAEANRNAMGGNWNTSTIYVGTYLGNQGAAFGVIERPRKA